MVLEKRILFNGQVLTLADNMDLSGYKPAKTCFLGKIFTFTRGQGWKGFYETIVGELYKINPEILRNEAETGYECFLANEPVIWGYWYFGNIGDERYLSSAKNYNDNWWTKIADNVFLYTKNNTNKKIEHLRKLFDWYEIKYEELTIYLY